MPSGELCGHFFHSLWARQSFFWGLPRTWWFVLGASIANSQAPPPPAEKDERRPFRGLKKLGHFDTRLVRPEDAAAGGGQWLPGKRGDVFHPAGGALCEEGGVVIMGVRWYGGGRGGMELGGCPILGLVGMGVVLGIRPLFRGAPTPLLINWG